MTIYIDVVFLINLVFDFALLMSTDLLLKRNASLKRILLGALIGEVSLIILFVNINETIFKIILTIIMCLVTFGYKEIKYVLVNFVYLYLVGIILGGFLYYLYNEFNISSSYSFKYIIILISSPLIVYIYSKLISKFKTDYNNRYDLRFLYGGNVFRGTAYLDSGNKLVSPISGNPIILVEKEYIRLEKLKLLPVPYNALNYKGIVNCFKPDSLCINGKVYKNILVGISERKFNIEGVCALLNARIEGL